MVCGGILGTESSYCISGFYVLGSSRTLGQIGEAYLNFEDATIQRSANN